MSRPIFDELSVSVSELVLGLVLAASHAASQAASQATSQAMSTQIIRKNEFAVSAIAPSTLLPFYEEIFSSPTPVAVSRTPIALPRHALRVLRHESSLLFIHPKS